MDPNTAPSTSQPNFTEINSPTVIPSTPQPIQNTSTSTIPSKSSSLFMKIMIPVVALLLLAAGSIGYMVYMKNQAIQELKSLVDSQLKSFTAIEKDYKDTEELLKLIDTRQDPESAEQSSSKQLLKFGEIPSPEDSNVLGIEEDLNIDIERKMAEKFREVSAEVDTITKNSERIKTVSTKSPIHKMFLPDSTDLLDKTETFTKETKPLMDYMNESTMLGIESTTLGLDIGLALNEAIIRGADEASVSNYQKKLEKMESIKNKYEKINISGLESSLQTDHNNELALFDESMAVFYEIEEALIQKDIVLLDKALSSLILQGQAESVNSQIGRLSFWQSNKTIQSLPAIKQEWKDFNDNNLH